MTSYFDVVSGCTNFTNFSPCMNWCTNYFCIQEMLYELFLRTRTVKQTKSTCTNCTSLFLTLWVQTVHELHVQTATTRNVLETFVVFEQKMKIGDILTLMPSSRRPTRTLRFRSSKSRRRIRSSRPSVKAQVRLRIPSSSTSRQWKLKSFMYVLKENHDVFEELAFGKRRTHGRLGVP